MPGQSTSESFTSNVTSEPTYLGWSDEGISILCAYDFIILICMLIFYSWLKRQDKNVIFFSGRADLTSHSAKMAIPKKPHYPRPVHLSWFNWFRATFQPTYEDILERSGLESVLYLQFLKCMIRITVVAGMLMALVGVPIYASGDANFNTAIVNTVEDPDYEGYYTGFFDWTISNLPDEDPGLAWIGVLVFFVSLWGNFQLRRLSTEAHELCVVEKSKYRGNNTTNKANLDVVQGVESHTAVIEGLPRNLLDKQILINHINQAQGDSPSIFDVEFARDLGQEFSGLADEYEETLQKLTFARNSYTTDTANKKPNDKDVVRPQHRAGAWGLGDLVDSITFYERQLEELRTKLRLCQSQRSLPGLFGLDLIRRSINVVLCTFTLWRLETFPSASTAFVTFHREIDMKRFVQNHYFCGYKTKIGDNSIPTGRLGTGALLGTFFGLHFLNLNNTTDDSENDEKIDQNIGGDDEKTSFPPTTWRVRAAPRPEAVNWATFRSEPKKAALIRHVSLLASLYLVVIFYTAWINALSSLSTMADLPLIGPLFDWILGLPTNVEEMIAGYFAAVVVLCGNELMYFVLNLGYYFDGYLSKGDVSNKVCQTFMIFLCLTNVVFPSIAPSTWSEFVSLFEQVSADPWNYLVDFILESVAPDSGYWVIFVIQIGWFSNFFFLFRFGPFLKRATLLAIAQTQNDIDHANRLKPFEFDLETYPWAILILLVSCYFSVTCPIIAPFSAMYFCTKYFCDRYLICYHFPTQRLVTSRTKFTQGVYGAKMCLLLQESVATFVLFARSSTTGGWIAFISLALSLYQYPDLKRSLESLNYDINIDDQHFYKTEPNILPKHLQDLYRGAYVAPSFTIDLGGKPSNQAQQIASMAGTEVSNSVSSISSTPTKETEEHLEKVEI